MLEELELLLEQAELLGTQYLPEFVPVGEEGMHSLEVPPAVAGGYPGLTLAGGGVLKFERPVMCIPLLGKLLAPSSDCLVFTSKGLALAAPE